MPRRNESAMSRDATRNEPLSAFWEATVNNMLGLKEHYSTRKLRKPAVTPLQPDGLQQAKTSSTRTLVSSPANCSTAPSRPEPTEVLKVVKPPPRAAPVAKIVPPPPRAAMLACMTAKAQPEPPVAQPKRMVAPPKRVAAAKVNQTDYFDIVNRAPPTHQRPKAGVQAGCTLAQQRIAAANNGRRLDQKEHQGAKTNGVDLTHYNLDQAGSALRQEDKAMAQMKRLWKKEVSPPSCVLDDLLYQAGRKNCAAMSSLPFEQFTHVVFSLNDSPLATPYACHSSYFVDVVDALDGYIQPYFAPVCAYLEEAIRTHGAETRICIHCQHGQSRSGALTIAFVMKHCNISLKAAFELVAARRPELRVNVAFIAQLQKWEKHLKGCIVPSLSLKQADQRDWCKCYFALNEKGSNVNLGQDNEF